MLSSIANLNTLQKVNATMISALFLLHLLCLYIAVRAAIDCKVSIEIANSGRLGIITMPAFTPTTRRCDIMGPLILYLLMLLNNIYLFYLNFQSPSLELGTFIFICMTLLCIVCGFVNYYYYLRLFGKKYDYLEHFGDGDRRSHSYRRLALADWQAIIAPCIISVLICIVVHWMVNNILKKDIKYIDDTIMDIGVSESFIVGEGEMDLI